MVPGSIVYDTLPSVDFDCVWENQNGDILFTWDHPAGASMSEYNIHAASSIGGPYSIIANVVYPENSFTTAASSLPVGSDFFYLTRIENCSKSIPSDTISPIKFSVTSSDVNCWDDTDGTISVQVDDYINVLQYEFSLDGVVNLNPFPLDTFFTGVSAGNHILTVDDVSSNCVVDVPVTISAPGFPLQALVSNSTNTCYGSDLAIAVGSSAGGTPGYSYEWFDSGLTSFSSNDTAFNLSSGSYYLEVMDANGCDTFTIVNVTDPQIPLDGSPQVFNVSCKGDASGMIVGDASGSWAPYTYYWLDINGDTLHVSETHISTRDTLKDLLAGSYQLHIEDFEGCRLEYLFNIDEPSTALSIDSMKVISDIACYGDSVGIARMYVSGGDPVYSYLWDNGETGIIASGLTSGYHTVSLTDDWGCEVVDSIFIPEGVLIESDLVVDTTVSCYDEQDGIASISSIGGATSSYTYFWSQGQTTVGVTSDVAFGLGQGSYYVTTRDILGCEVVDSIYISQPEPLLMEASELDWIDCNGDNNGEAFSFATGGTAPYSFDWDVGTWSGDTVTTLTPGVHFIEVTDVRGCTATDTVLTHEPPAVYIDIDSSQTIYPYCLGVNTASLTGIAGGGTAGYTYVWDDNVVQPQTTATAVSLLAGTYTITVTDIKGCTASATKTISNADPLSDILVIDTMLIQALISCYDMADGEATALVSGGHAPYSYQWYGPNSYVSTNTVISNLSAGSYSVTVRDTNNCMVNSFITLEEADNILFYTLGAADETCLGACDGEMQVDVIGGTSPYTAIATEATTGDVISIPMLLGNDSIVSGICSGVYTLSFTDENGCSSTLINGGVSQQTISTSATTVAQINTSIMTDILCSGDSTGFLEVLNPNMNAGFYYIWRDLNGNLVSNTTTADSLLAGTYVLYAKYDTSNGAGTGIINGCTSTDTATVIEIPVIDPSAVITHVDCFGNSTGALQATTQGGTMPYFNIWNPGGVQGAQLNNVPAGVYTLTVTDGNGCQEMSTFDVTQPQAIFTSITQNGYVLTVNNPTGGSLPYSYSWRKQLSPISIGSGNSYIVTNYGTYYVIVTDANNCTFQSNMISYSEGPLSILDITDINLKVYPNPFREATTVDFGQRINEATIRIVDVYGKLIETYDLSDTDKYIIERTNKASGVYFMEIGINNQYLNNIKLVIE